MKQGAPVGCWAARLHRKPNPRGSEPPGNGYPPRPALCTSPLPPNPGADGREDWMSVSSPNRSVIAKPFDRKPEPCSRDLSIPNPGVSILTFGLSSLSSRAVMLDFLFTSRWLMRLEMGGGVHLSARCPPGIIRGGQSGASSPCGRVARGWACPRGLIATNFPFNPLRIFIRALVQSSNARSHYRRHAACCP